MDGIHAVHPLCVHGGEGVTDGGGIAKGTEHQLGDVRPVNEAVDFRILREEAVPGRRLGDEAAGTQDRSIEVG
ncbi:hypothetical protein GGQ64_003687 [Rhizobium azooxidifex]|uniref:Uncharacterized protein n=1 Tax=Mycoplana azooxidifex TaxID=1636188 RepID=A0A7W6GKR2_9HYPH|nr:hypothetical protein [Mycoplana azooxidifex]MBB3978453.1 hypothetical protein [Mycoplana azooxidifex]